MRQFAFEFENILFSLKKVGVSPGHDVSLDIISIYFKHFQAKNNILSIDEV